MPAPPTLLATLYIGKGVKAQPAKGRKRHASQGMDRGEINALEPDSPAARARQRRNKMPKAEALIVYQLGLYPVEL
jgi:hypothetical protein